MKEGEKKENALAPRLPTAASTAVQIAAGGPGI